MINPTIDRELSHRSSLTTSRQLKESKNRIDDWLYSMDKWIKIIENWENEGILIAKLLNVANFGDYKNMETQKLHDDFANLFSVQITPLKREIFDAQSNIERMEKFPISYRDRVMHYKTAMRRLGDLYQQKKNLILKHLVRIYPIRIV